MSSKFRIALRSAGNASFAAAVVAVALFTASRSALAVPIGPGFDLFNTPSGAFLPPIPAGFFGSGSDPFPGPIPLMGMSIGPGNTDTRVERLSGFDIPVGEEIMIPIEIVALSLVSVSPITVTYNGGQNPEPWTLNVTLAPTQQPGQMTVRKAHPNGGTFTSNLPVQAKLTFRNVDNPLAPAIGVELPDQLRVMDPSPGQWSDMPPPWDAHNEMFPSGGLHVTDPPAMGMVLSLDWDPAAIPEPRAWLMLAAVTLGATVVIGTRRLRHQHVCV
jgi:hypothetical protein